MARGVNKVQGIGLAVFRFIIKVDGPGFDGDAPLPLQVHVVQELVLHLPLGHGVTQLQQAVCQGGFAVVNVGDDGKVADMGLIVHTL